MGCAVGVAAPETPMISAATSRYADIDMQWRANQGRHDEWLRLPADEKRVTSKPKQPRVMTMDSTHRGGTGDPEG